MKEAVPLFVYGSLMSGLQHHDQLAGAKPLGGAVLLGHQLVLYEGAYPALVAVTRSEMHAGQSPPATVVGELFVVEEEHLRRLDVFEECPQLYERIEVILSTGMRAEAYALPTEQVGKYPVILGDYRRFLRENPHVPLRGTHGDENVRRSEHKG